jgi:amino acid adenylation domain-containing protein
MYTEKLKQPIFDSRLKAERDYWVGKLSGRANGPGLTTDFERPMWDAGEREAVKLDLPEELSQGLSKITNDSPVLVYTALLAALGVCLSRHTGSRAVLVGSPPRAREGEAPAPNALAMLCEVDERESFKALLLRTREAVLESYGRQGYPFDRLVSDLGLEEAGDRCPLFDVALVLEGFHAELPAATKHDLTFTFNGAPGPLGGEVSFNPALFRSDTVERLAGHYVTLLGGALAGVETPVGEVGMLTEGERRQGVHELFEEQARRAPDAVALALGGEHLTYEALNRAANRLARRLRAMGVGPEVTVGVMLERSFEQVVALLGVLKAGGAYLPLDPEYPPARLAFMLEDSAVAVLVVGSETPAGLPHGDARLVRVDAEPEESAGRGDANPKPLATDSNAAYVIYTSGSTGTPKGVCVEHRGVSNLVEAQVRAFRIGDDSRVFQFASLGFDASVSEIFTALAAGATLDLGVPGAAHAGRELARALRERGVTVVTLPPAVLATLPEEGLDSLRTLVSAGEACTAEVVRRWSPGRLLINAYGPTETTVCATLKVCGAEERTAPTVGRPMQNTQAYVLDSGSRPVPVGVAGELCVGGRGLARGYVKRPDLTAEKFTPHQFAEGGGERLYRTGDLARWRADGELEFLGRLDHQVKVRGFRIETGEVEAALRSHTAVREAVVLARGESAEQKRLVAYVLPDAADGAAPTPGELRAFVQERLPEYMTPSAFVLLEELPLTPNGKIDVRALPDPEGQHPAAGAEFVEPRTPSEKLLALIWAEVLGAERVGAEDNFFELGGHSLLATQVVSRVHDIIGIDLPVVAVFEAPTVAEFAAKLAEHGGPQVDEAEAARILAEIEQLSDAEAEDIVADERRALEAGGSNGD